MKKTIFLIFSALITISSYAHPGHGKQAEFTRHDTLRGALTHYRTAYDVTFYNLSLRIDTLNRTISGNNAIHFKVVHPFDTIQIDLFANMNIDKIVFNGRELSYFRDSNAVFVIFPSTQRSGSGILHFHYNGSPLQAKNAPWDGGFVWKHHNNLPWVGVAVQGTGASLWWPNKDHLSDKPDSVRLIYEVPSNLVAVGNGQFAGKQNIGGGYTRYSWRVTYPISNYNVTLNIADYVHIKDSYQSTLEGAKPLALDYYVLRGNEEKAREHFQQVKPMMACFERLMGPYPFFNDGYKLVETPYWGMEHQSAIAYGNNYENNAFGFDFIIIHESAHEWWGNSVSVADLAEMWIHEAFTTYSETLYLECTQGKQVAQRYIERQRQHIRNKQPLVGPKGVNYHHWEGADIYYKGAWMLHTLRNIIEDDRIFIGIFHEFYQNHKMGFATTEDFVKLVNERTGKDFTAFFQQYLYHENPPILQYYYETKGSDYEMHYRWKADVPGFEMPVKLRLQTQHMELNPTTNWQKLPVTSCHPKDISVRMDLAYIDIEEIKKPSQNPFRNMNLPNLRRQ